MHPGRSRSHEEARGDEGGHGHPPAAAVRAPQDAMAAVVGAAVLGVSALPVSEDRISGAERAVFEVVNGVPGLPFGPIWLGMQLGNIAVVPAAAVAALLARRPRLAATIVLAGALAYGLAKVVKQFVTRGRPASLVADVEIRGTAAHGLGFVSGHAAVAVALATVAFAFLRPPWRWLVVGLAAFVCVARVYVAAHLPLDVVGGAALGVLVGSVAKLALGRPARCS